MKKFLSLFVSLMLVCGLLTGCQGKENEPDAIRIGSLKGPTTLGLLSMMNEQKEASDANSENEKYEFHMMTAADELLPLMIKGELDIALLPANVASILYGRMEGNLKVIDINTLGVLYMVSGDESIDELKDLENKTLYLTGKGTTPDYVLRYLLAQAGVDVSAITLEFKSEATEVAAMLAEHPDAIGLLPEPFVTAALAQNDQLKVVMDMTGQWDAWRGTEGGMMVTGVTVVRSEFLKQYPEAVMQFLADHAKSTEYVNANVDQAATWAVEQGIVAKEPLARKAIPECNIVCIQGQEMKEALSGYLQVIFNQSKEAVGGSLPGEDFYFVQ
ncbi:MAG: ABC transporter substrate-binding protein [Lachnospiraceae bacterium]|nr:ABC transporter substrate-binding protein [Lachnospiraceae bacterium]